MTRFMAKFSSPNSNKLQFFSSCWISSFKLTWKMVFSISMFVGILQSMIARRFAIIPDNFPALFSLFSSFLSPWKTRGDFAEIAFLDFNDIFSISFSDFRAIKSQFFAFFAKISKVDFSHFIRLAVNEDSTTLIR